MQEAFRSQVEEQAKLWQESVHGSETMKAQIRQMILYHSLCEEKEASGMQTMSGWYREYEQAGRLPAKDKREGKWILEELRARVLLYTVFPYFCGTPHPPSSAYRTDPFAVSTGTDCGD